MKIRTKVFLFLSSILLSHYSVSASQDTAYYFYRPLPYGSQRNFNPLQVIINGGFGIMQIDNRSNKLNSIDYKTGCENVWMNITHPFREIKKFGVKNFIEREVFPTKIKRSSGQWVPNYQLHLIGGGMTYRGFVEWFRYHNYKHPKVFAFVSLSMYHYINEIVENSDYRGTNMDPIADLLIFDPLSILLFSSDRVSRFFGKTLQMSDWSFQPVITPEGRLENVGQNFSIKINLPRTDHWSFFYFFGVHGAVGLSYKRMDGRSFSFGGGVVAKDLQDVDPDTQKGVKTTSLRWTAGFFYDRNNSLLASLVLAGTKGYKMRLNVYPGLIPLGKFSPGMFCAIGKQQEFIIGIHMHHIPIGFGLSL